MEAVRFRKGDAYVSEASRIISCVSAYGCAGKSAFHFLVALFDEPGGEESLYMEFF